MGKIEQFEIAFDKSKEVYSPGESICGTVTLKVNQSLQCKAIKVSCNGFCGITNKVNDTAWSLEEQYFNSTISVADKGTLKQGEHKFPFKFLISASAPTSFEGSYGKIIYRVKAFIDTPRFTKDYSTEKAFYLLRLLNLNEVPDIWRMSREKKGKREEELDISQEMTDDSLPESSLEMGSEYKPSSSLSSEDEEVKSKLKVKEKGDEPENLNEDDEAKVALSAKEGPVQECQTGQSNTEDFNEECCEHAEDSDEVDCQTQRPEPSKQPKTKKKGASKDKSDDPDGGEPVCLTQQPQPSDEPKKKKKGPSCSAVTQQFTYMLMKTGTVVLRAETDMKGYTPGQVIQVTASIFNQSGKTTGNITASLMQRVTYEMKRPTHDIRAIAEVEGGVVKAGKEVEWKEQIIVPALPQSSLSGCELIKIEYYVKVSLKSPDVMLTLPIHIGNVSLDKKRCPAKKAASTKEPSASVSAPDPSTPSSTPTLPPRPAPKPAPRPAPRSRMSSHSSPSAPPAEYPPEAEGGNLLSQDFSNKRQSQLVSPNAFSYAPGLLFSQNQQPSGPPAGPSGLPGAAALYPPLGAASQMQAPFILPPDYGTSSYPQDAPPTYDESCNT